MGFINHEYVNRRYHVPTHLEAVCPECGETVTVIATRFGGKYILDDKIYICTECATMIDNKDIEGNN